MQSEAATSTGQQPTLASDPSEKSRPSKEPGSFFRLSYQNGRHLQQLDRRWWMASSQWSVVVMNRTGAFSRAVRDGSNLGRTVDLLGINGSLLPILDWDSWDESLWTPEQRLLLEQGVAPRHVYVSMGVLLSLVVLFGLIANATILYVFSRYFYLIINIFFFGYCKPHYAAAAVNLICFERRNYISTHLLSTLLSYVIDIH